MSPSRRLFIAGILDARTRSARAPGLFDLAATALRAGRSGFFVRALAKREASWGLAQNIY